jgi:hypothetical protein
MGNRGRGDIVAWMEARHDQADHILCIVSSAYLAKPYSAWERQAAQWATVTDRPNFAVPVFVEPCKAPTLLAHRKRCDLYGLSEADARARLKTFLEPAAQPPRGIFPGGAEALSGMASAPPSFPGKAALSNAPIAVPLHFMGRGVALAAIETALQRNEGRVAIMVLHGMRGVGKTNHDRLFFIQLYRWFPSILQVLTTIRPETLVRWHRAGFRCYWRWKSRPQGGRPQIDTELRRLVRRMSVENPLWGAPRIHGELLKLRFEVAQSSVAKYMVKR